MYDCKTLAITKQETTRYINEARQICVELDFPRLEQTINLLLDLSQTQLFRRTETLHPKQTTAQPDGRKDIDS
jgi:hypothetical protein